MGDLNSKLKDKKDQKGFHRYRNRILKVQGIGLKTKNSQTYCSTTTLSLSLSKLSYLIFLNPLFYCTSPFFIGIFHFNLSTAGLVLVGLEGYLSHHPFVLPLFLHEIGLLWVFPLFRSVNQHLMWQRVGGNTSLMWR